jgi:hypothetical protein
LSTLQHKRSPLKRGNQNSYIEEEQTTQWPKEKVQKDKQPSTTHTHKTKDRTKIVRSSVILLLPLFPPVIDTSRSFPHSWFIPLSSPPVFSGVRFVRSLVLINQEWGKEREVSMTGGNKGNNKITELRTILQRKSQNS